MKKIKSLRLLCFLLLSLCALAWVVNPLHARAQQDTNPLLQPEMASTNAPTSPETFFQSTFNYFTSANTNYTWTGNTLEIAVGADYMSGGNWANYVDGRYNLSSVSSNSIISRMALEARIRNAGIAGTLMTAEGGVSYSLIQYYSVKLSAGLQLGYDFSRDSVLFEPDLDVRSKLTPNTFLGLWISEPVWFRGAMNKIPDIGIETGFTY